MDDNDLKMKIKRKIEAVDEVESCVIRDHSQALYVDYHVCVKKEARK